jgi:digeranylgeranylglycerophospholipid reductase
MGGTSSTKPHVTLLRREFGRYLSQQAVGTGATLHVRTLVRSVELVAPGNVRVRAVNKDFQKELTLCTRIVVSADGVHTLASRLFGFGFCRQPETSASALICELDWSQCPLEKYEVHVGGQIIRWGYAWIFPKRDVLNVGLLCLSSKGEDSRQLEARLRRFVENHPLLRRRKVSRRAGAFIPAAPAERIYHITMLAVGDAAGMVEPMTGAGIADSIIAGGIAADVVHQALTEESFDAEFMKQCQRRWQATECFKMLWLQHHLTQLFRPLSRYDGTSLPN